MRRRIFSSVSVSPRWPCTWAQPVMAGLTLWRRDNGEIRSANASLRAIGCGRGPTIDISPSSTFTSWGSSSIFVRLRIRPTRVTRGSFLTACVKWQPSSIVVIDRNLRTLMTSLLYPCRVWRKNTGPRESSLTASETASKSGENASRARPATDMSNARFASFFNRWLIFYDDVRQAATLDHIGELCVVGLEDNRILVKQMQPGRA